MKAKFVKLWTWRLKVGTYPAEAELLFVFNRFALEQTGSLQTWIFEASDLPDLPFGREQAGANLGLNSVACPPCQLTHTVRAGWPLAGNCLVS